MKVKALRYKKEFNDFQEFVLIEEYGGEPMVFTSEIPKLQPETATIEDMRKYIENNDYYEDLEINWDKLELVEFDLIESGVVGADIRNKLTPPLNLVALLRIYFSETDDKEDDVRNKEKLLPYIKKEMEQSEKSVKYISNLL